MFLNFYRLPLQHRFRGFFQSYRTPQTILGKFILYRINTNKLWNTKLILEFRNPKIVKSTIRGILHLRLLWNLFYPNSEIKLRHYEKFRPESALIQKFMYKNVIFWIFNFTIWYILKRTPTITVLNIKKLVVY